MTSAETAAAAGEAAIQEDDDDDDGGGGDSLGRSASSLSLPESARPGWEQRRRSCRRSSSRLDSSGLDGGLAGSDKERGDNAAGALDDDDDDDHSRGGRENHHHTFPDLFGACRPSHHERHRRRERSLSSPPSSPSATLEPTRPSSVGRNRNRGRDRQPPPPPRRRLSLEVPRTAADRWVDEGGNYGAGEEQQRVAGAGGAARQIGCTSDDGGAGGHGAGSRGSRRRLRRLTGNNNNNNNSNNNNKPSSLPQAGASAAAGAAGGMETGEEHAEEKEGEGRKGAKASVAAAAVVAATASATELSGSGRDVGGSGGGRSSSRRWRSIDKLSRALGSTRRRTSRQGGAARGEGGEGSEQKMNFFTEKDLDELLHSTFFIKMCDDASWLYVEDHPFQPELNWLLSLWGGYKIAPRFQGEVKQNEAHRMLFQAENGRHRGHVRIRSRATNTFLFFLGIKQPLTWVQSLDPAMRV
ncbi:expressed unknown protein [Ectocarpus siliculosus]|uniref:Uncharacterized protein n=1 Tax=Ectocarpus siliculosus TaxID=2880 RepID=D8LSC8_ECTSI|nr:expressed unknown protein [Ectocarpus siliculosus]|eukprot:CBN75185.1 expressed unknown protein [Ectocarpus siliculosus]